ncbi:MAG: sulfotransferase [Bacteroidia bacterium]|nr:sulfotransferase [Bacteroidia bacterium]
MKLVFTKGIGLKPIYLLRLIALIPTSILSEVFTLVEKLKFGGKIRKTQIEKPPVFIIGHWRSGTTLLHQLIYLDSQFTAPTIIQTVIPDHFIFSTKYWVPVLQKVMPPTRPMDEVEMRPLDPMEDEWALIRLGSPTPFLKIFFPSHKTGFLNSSDEFIPAAKDLERWKINILLLLKKITLLTPKQIVLKNPFHTPRMSLLAETFPGAKFIHIVRHPYKIVPSAINMWNIVAKENAFRDGWQEPATEETAHLLNEFWKSVNANKPRLGDGQFAEIRFEDLEKDPVNELKRVYAELDLTFSSEHEKSIIQFMEGKKNYRKNIFNLSDNQKSSINKILESYMKSYSYES